MAVKRDYSWTDTGRTKSVFQGHIGASEAHAIESAQETFDSVGDMAHGFTAIASAYMSAKMAKEAAETQASNYRIQQMQAKTSAYQAKVQGKMDILNLQTRFNKMMANNAVMAAAQGRSGGSVMQIAQASEAQFNWDKDFTKLSSDLQESGYQSQATQYGIAADATKAKKEEAMFKAAMDVGTSLYSIGS